MTGIEVSQPGSIELTVEGRMTSRAPVQPASVVLFNASNVLSVRFSCRTNAFAGVPSTAWHEMACCSCDGTVVWPLLLFPKHSSCPDDALIPQACSFPADTADQDVRDDGPVVLP